MKGKMLVFRIIMLAVSLAAVLYVSKELRTYVDQSRANQYFQEYSERANENNSPMPKVFDLNLLTEKNEKFSFLTPQKTIAIAHVMFASCTGPCPLMIQKLKQIAQKISSENLRLISFTMDPVADTPAVLADYKQKYALHTFNWEMVTGDLATMMKMIQGMLKLPIDPNNPQSLIHSTKFVLIDANQQIIGYFDADSPEDLVRLEAEAKTLLSMLSNAQRASRE